MSMKFFRQTKETKRKLSFFMALAMVISLLPVSPVAKAAAESPVTFTVYNNVSGTAVAATSTTTGTALITLTSKVTDQKIKTANITVAIAPKGTSTSGAFGNKTVNVNVSGTATAITSGCININPVSNGEVKIEVSNITQADSIVLNGDITLEDKTSGGDETPDVPPAEEDMCIVTFNSSSLGEHMTLEVKNDTKSITSGDEVKKGSVLDFEVLPDKGFICADKPNITASGAAATVFTETNGKYIAKVTVNAAKAEMTVSGGKVTKIESTVEVPKDNANGAIVDETIKAPEVLDSIMNAFVNVEPVSGSKVTSLDDIKKILATSGSSIKTSFDVKDTTNEYTTDAKANTLADNATLPEDVTISKDSIVKMIKAGVALDITINSILTSDDVVIKTTVTSLGKKIKITMSIPEGIKKDGRTYYAIRIHDGKATILECVEADGKISFESDKFSTYIISFTEKEEEDKPTSKPPVGGGGIGSYVPSNSATPAPSATAAPSASPSADPSAAPGTDSSAAPTESGAPAPGGDTTPTKAPAATDKPVDTDKDNTTGGSTAVKVGKKATVSGSQYKVTAVKGTRTVQFTKGKKNAKSIVVPSTVKISGKNYKVTTIAKNAFKGNKKLAKVTIGKNVNKIGVSAFQNCSKLKSIIIKSTKLTAKKVGKNAFKGINKKATFKVPKSKVKAYKKIVKAKGAGKNVKVKK